MFGLASSGQDSRAVKAGGNLALSWRRIAITVKMPPAGPDLGEISLFADA